MGRDPASVAAWIRDVARELEIDGIGICDAGALPEARSDIQAAIERELIPADRAPASKTLDRLTAPASHLKGARSVISAFGSYHTGEGNSPDPTDGVVAYYTRANYYRDLYERLKGLSVRMKDEFGCRTKAFSNYVTLAEKPVAQKAGLGFYGKNGIIITPRHGSLVVLGEIVTDLEIEPDTPLESSCGSCRQCMDACPTGAIPAPQMVNRHRCIQHLSERLYTVPLDIRDVWQNRLYGCTTCQDVCPLNRDLPTITRDVKHGRVGASVPLDRVLRMDETEFESMFSDNQIGRREPDAIRRNAIIAAGNSRSEAFLPYLKILAAHANPRVRQHSLWAVWKIRGQASRPALERALDAEKAPEAVEEINTLLDAPEGNA
jgi:epoxyqueuosine reductase